MNAHSKEAGDRKKPGAIASIGLAERIESDRLGTFDDGEADR